MSDSPARSSSNWGCQTPPLSTGLGMPAILLLSGGTSCQEATRDVFGAPLMLKFGWWQEAPFDIPLWV